MRQLLERAGARVDSAYDGREAVMKALASAFDVVLMDLRLPHMDGRQATRDLRRQSYSVPIIGLTADAARLHRDEAIDAGCDECLSKPFKIAELIGSLRAFSRH